MNVLREKDASRAVVLSLGCILESPGELKGADARAPPQTSLVFFLVVWPCMILMFSWAKNHWSRTISRLLVQVTGLLMVPFISIKSKLKEKMLFLT